MYIYVCMYMNICIHIYPGGGGMGVSPFSKMPPSRYDRTDSGYVPYP